MPRWREPIMEEKGTHTHERFTFSQTEVQKLDNTTTVDLNVFRLDVTVNDAFVV